MLHDPHSKSSCTTATGQTGIMGEGSTVLPPLVTSLYITHHKAKPTKHVALPYPAFYLLPSVTADEIPPLLPRGLQPQQSAASRTTVAWPGHDLLSAYQHPLPQHSCCSRPAALLSAPQTPPQPQAAAQRPEPPAAIHVPPPRPSRPLAPHLNSRNTPWRLPPCPAQRSTTSRHCTSPHSCCSHPAKLRSPHHIPLQPEAAAQRPASPEAGRALPVPPGPSPPPPNSRNLHRELHLSLPPTGANR